MALFPTFLVPLSMLLHVLSLRFLFRTRAAAGDVREAVVGRASQ